MGWEHPPEVVSRAQDLYVVDRLTFEEVSAATEVSVRQLKRWAAKYRWRQKRAELQAELAGIRENTIRMRGKMIRECLEQGTKNPMAHFAAAGWERLAVEADKLTEERRRLQADPEQLRPIGDAGDIVAALEEAVRLRLASLINAPVQADFKAIRDIRQALELVGEMKAAAGDDGPKRQGISKETADEIRRRILFGKS